MSGKLDSLICQARKIKHDLSELDDEKIMYLTEIKQLISPMLEPLVDKIARTANTIDNIDYVGSTCNQKIDGLEYKNRLINTEIFISRKENSPQYITMDLYIYPDTDSEVTYWNSQLTIENSDHIHVLAKFYPYTFERDKKSTYYNIFSKNTNIVFDREEFEKEIRYLKNDCEQYLISALETSIKTMNSKYNKACKKLNESKETNRL